MPTIWRSNTVIRWEDSVSRYVGIGGCGGCEALSLDGDDYGRPQ